MSVNNSDNFTNSIINEASIQINTIQRAKEIFYTKDDVKALLSPMFNYLELLSQTYTIETAEGLSLTYRRPVEFR